MPHSRWAFLLLLPLLLTACPRQGSAEDAPSAPQSGAQPSAPAGGTLAWDGTRLTLDGRALELDLAGRGPAAYQLALGGTPQVATALLDALEPCSFVLHPDPASAEADLTEPYRNYLPQALPGGGAALISMPDPLTGVSNGLAIVARSGAELWRNAPGEMAQLLLPALDEPVPADAAPGVMLLRWVDGDPLAPYGEQPELLRLDPAGAAETRLALGASGPVAGVEMLATSAGAALLLMQYDYQSYEFVTVGFSPLAITGRWELTGQPLTRALYPGPGYEYIGLTRSGDATAVIVFKGDGVQGVIESWTFDMLAGTQRAAACLEDLPLAADAANGADSVPGGVPYPQTILPSTGDAAWQVPAVRDGAGRVFVVFTDGSVTWAAPPA